jgi:hypothetical protein
LPALERRAPHKRAVRPAAEGEDHA